HIEPPTIDAYLFHPIASDGPKVITYLWMIIVELRQAAKSPPALVVRLLRARNGEPFKVIPVAVTRGFAMLDHVLKCEELSSAVVLRYVQDNANPIGMHLPHQLLH